MSETETDALGALLDRYVLELNSLQAEDFVERIQSWGSELEAAVSGALLAVTALLRRQIDACLQELRLSGRAAHSIERDA